MRTAFGRVTSGPGGPRPFASGAARGGRLAQGGEPGVYLTVEDGARGIDLGAAFQGRLDSTLKADLERVEQAYTAAMKAVTERAKGRLRADVEAGGFKNAAKLAKTWRGITYPKSGASLSPAALIFTKAQVLIDAFGAGVTIRAKGGRFLAIPLAPAKAILRRGNQAANRSRNAFGKFAREENPVARVEAALGQELVPIIGPSGSGVLVAMNRTTLTPGGREAKRQTGRGTPVFALVKSATLKKRIKGRALLAEIERGFPAAFAAELSGRLGGEG